MHYIVKRYDDVMTSIELEFVRACVEKHFGGEPIVSLGKAYAMDDLEFVFAKDDGRPAAFAAYRFAEQECEIVALVSAVENRGYGAKVVEEVLARAQAHGCRRLWLVATNDNLLALGWYQRRGFQMVQVHRNSMERERAMKPSIPHLGLHRIPLRDEIELEIRFDSLDPAN